MTDTERERYERSAAKQRHWWANMTPEERAEYERKRKAGMARYWAGREQCLGKELTDNG